MDPISVHQRQLSRRVFLGRAACNLGGMVLTSLLEPGLLAAMPSGAREGLPHFAPKAKRVLCLFQSEGFSHLDLFDHKPVVEEYAGREIPPEIKGAQRVTGMTSGQGKFPVLPPLAKFRRCGNQGLWM